MQLLTPKNQDSSDALGTLQMRHVGHQFWAEIGAKLRAAQNEAVGVEKVLRRSYPENFLSPVHFPVNTFQYTGTFTKGCECYSLLYSHDAVCNE